VNKLHRLILLKKAIKQTTEKFNEEIKNRYKTLEKNNIHNFNFAKHITSIFAEVNFNINYYERNYQRKLNIYKLCKLIKKYILSYVIRKIFLFIQAKINKAIVIQSNVRRLIICKEFNALKKEMNIKSIIIQKYVRGFILRKKKEEDLKYILDTIDFNKRQKEYDRKVKIMIRKRNAIRVIEEWWEKILEERKQKELEEKIKQMPKDCQRLYRQFRKLRKQTKSLRNEFNEFTRGKFKFGP